MNADYAHLLPGGKLDFDLLSRALTAFSADTGLSFDAMGSLCGVTKMTISRASRGMPVNAETLLKLCIFLDLNPLELVASEEAVSRGQGTVTSEAEARADV